ncbi:MAG: LLM class F420-dependent oxidoreductase [Actinomycetota bacterium]|nr:LLM class F420-dependent oxidoreductase [Actinomycetota bacterium]
MSDRTDRRARLRDAIGRVGVWSFAFDRLRTAEEREAARRIEALGYPVLWIPESVGSKDVMAHASLLLSATERLVVATGIANIWARDPMAMANGARLLDDAFPGRFVLGIGVSHGPSVERRGVHRYERPYRRMREYLGAMDEARYSVVDAPEPPPRLLAALGPRMLRLAAERAEGAHPYFVPVEHTAGARAALGPEPVLAVELAVVLEPDADPARRIARAYMEGYLKLDNYANNLRRLGWSDQDLQGGGSDGLVDAIVAWGDVEAVYGRVREHLDAGADHVCVQALAEDPADVALRQLGELAPALLEA